MLFDAGPLGPMHGRSGAARITCLDRAPSIGTRVLSSVSAFGACARSFGSRWRRATRPVCVCGRPRTLRVMQCVRDFTRIKIA
eukprot:5590122-Prymnesium_polylepis.1